MTDIDKKREEIREELAMVLAHIDGRYWNDLTVVEAGDYIKKTERVVIKMDRELPKPGHVPEGDFEWMNDVLHRIRKAYEGAGYVAVEPLIKEDTNETNKGTTVHTGKDNS